MSAPVLDIWFGDGTGTVGASLSVTSNTATNHSAGTSVSNVAGRVAIVFVYASTGGLSTVGVTFAGTSMTQIGTTTSTPGTRKVAMFGIKGDANIPTGNVTIVVSTTPTGGVVVAHCYVFNGCDTTTGWNGNVSNTGTSTSASSGAITSSTNDYCVGGISDDNANGTGFVGTGGTTADNRDGRFDGNYSLCREAGASSVTMDVTIGSASVGWAMLAVNILGAAGAGGGSTMSFSRNRGQRPAAFSPGGAR